MAVTAARKTAERDGKQFSHPVAATEVIFKGAMIALDASGDVVDVTEATGLIILGIAEESVDNTDGDAGDVRVTARAGTFKLANADAGDAITRADIGQPCYATDNETVSDVVTGRSLAGVIVDVDADGGIWVLMGPDASATLTDLDTP
jgi:hypothetical protein